MSKPATGFHTNPERINRKGRPKGISITEMVKAALEEIEPKTGEQWKDLIIKRILFKATVEGDTVMLKAIWSYIDGMPKQNIDLAGKVEHNHVIGLPKEYHQLEATPGKTNRSIEKS